MREEGKVLFYLSDDKLVIANTGKPFSKLGIEAICNAHRSSKPKASADTIIDSVNSAENILQQIRESRIKSYKSSMGDIEEHAKGETNLTDEYAGRVLLELLQNAHDASGENQIGEKGIGFKGVLNISRDELRIHSRHLHFGFSQAETKECLNDAKLPTDNIPAMRLPFWKDLVQETEEIQEIAKKYDTVVILPFANVGADKARNKAIEKLQKDFTACANDETLLLFLPNMKEIIWQQQEQSNICWQRTQKNKNIDIKRGNEPATRWQLWQGKHAKLAMRLDAQGLPKPEKDYPKLRAYFTTDELNSLPLLIHANFPLKAGRDYINQDSDIERYHACIADIAKLIKEALGTMKTCGGMLDCLQNNLFIINDVTNDIYQAVREAVLPLIPPDTGGLALKDLRLPPNNIEIEIWESFKRWLNENRQNKLKGLPFLPLDTETAERQQTLHKLLSDKARLDVDALHDLPLLPVHDEKEPCSPKSMVIFFPPSEKKKKTTQTSSTDALPKTPFNIKFLYANNLNDYEGVSNFIQKELNVKLFDLQNIASELLKELKANPKIAEKKPREILNFLYETYQTTPKEDRKDAAPELLELIKVKTLKDEWQPANKVYAGTAWGSKPSFQKLYTDRYFLENFPKDKTHWKQFYQWLEVATRPRMIKSNDERAFIKWQRWQEYINNVKENIAGYYYSDLKSNYILDGDIAKLETKGAFDCIALHWEMRDAGLNRKEYTTVTLNYRPHDGRKSLESRSADSYYLWCLKNCAWVPAKSLKTLQPPHKIFSAGKIIETLKTGGWFYQLDTNENTSPDFLKKIGIRSEWSELKSEDWQSWLEKAGENTETPKATKKERVHNLYRALLQNAPQMDGAIRLIKGEWGLWAINRLNDNTETWKFFAHQEKHNLYYLDRSDLTNIKLENLWVLPVKLDDLQDEAQTYLGIKPLSENLWGEVVSPTIKKTATDKIMRHISRRWAAIYALLEKQYPPDKMAIIPQNSQKLGEEFTVAITANLQVSFALAHETLETISLPSYHQTQKDEAVILWLDNRHKDLWGGESLQEPSEELWWAVAESLSYIFDLYIAERSSIKDLLACTEEKLETILNRFGITETTIKGITKEIRDANQKAEETTDGVVDANEDEVTTDTHNKPIAENIPNENNRHIGQMPMIATTQRQVSQARRVIESPHAPASISNTNRQNTSGNVTRPSNQNNNGKTSRNSALVHETTLKEATKAHEYIYEKLQNHFPEWTIEQEITFEVNGIKSRTDEVNRIKSRTDIVLYPPNMPQQEDEKAIHIEVKYTQNPQQARIFWSFNQTQLAKSCPTRYFIVVLTPDADKSKAYHEYWFTNPLAQLTDYSRQVEHKTTARDIVKTDGWEDINASNKQPTIAKFIINLGDISLPAKAEYSFEQAVREQILANL